MNRFSPLATMLLLWVPFFITLLVLQPLADQPGLIRDFFHGLALFTFCIPFMVGAVRLLWINIVKNRTEPQVPEVCNLAWIIAPLGVCAMARSLTVRTNLPPGLELAIWLCPIAVLITTVFLAKRHRKRTPS